MNGLSCSAHTSFLGSEARFPNCWPRLHCAWSLPYFDPQLLLLSLSFSLPIYELDDWIFKDLSEFVLLSLAGPGKHRAGQVLPMVPSSRGYWGTQLLPIPIAFPFHFHAHRVVQE